MTSEIWPIVADMTLTVEQAELGTGALDGKRVDVPLMRLAFRSGETSSFMLDPAAYNSVMDFAADENTRWSTAESTVEMIAAILADDVDWNADTFSRIADVLFHQGWLESCMFCGGTKQVDRPCSNETCAS